MTKFNELAVSVQLFNGKEAESARLASLENSLFLSVKLLMSGRADRFEQGIAACSTRGHGPKIKALIEQVWRVASTYRQEQKEAKLLDKDGNCTTLPDIYYFDLVAACFALTSKQEEKKAAATSKRAEAKAKKEAEAVALIEKASQAEKLAVQLASVESEKDTIVALQAENTTLQAQNAFLLDLLEQVKAAKSLKEVKALLAE
jgi:hypothetical protein